MTEKRIPAYHPEDREGDFARFDYDAAHYVKVSDIKQVVLTVLHDLCEEGVSMDEMHEWVHKQLKALRGGQGTKPGGS